MVLTYVSTAAPLLIAYPQALSQETMNVKHKELDRGKPQEIDF